MRKKVCHWRGWREHRLSQAYIFDICAWRKTSVVSILALLVVRKTLYLCLNHKTTIIQWCPFDVTSEAVYRTIFVRSRVSKMSFITFWYKLHEVSFWKIIFPEWKLAEKAITDNYFAISSKLLIRSGLSP